MNTSVLDTVRRIASDVLELPLTQVTDQTSPGTAANWDSVQHLNLVLALEQAFAVTFEPEELDQMKNIGEVVTLVERKRREAP
jgi:acyl carrier protein